MEKLHGQRSWPLHKRLKGASSQARLLCFSEDVPAPLHYAVARKKRLRLLSEERLSPHEEKPCGFVVPFFAKKMVPGAGIIIQSLLSSKNACFIPFNLKVGTLWHLINSNATFQKRAIYGEYSIIMGNKWGTICLPISQSPNGNQTLNPTDLKR